MERDDTIALIGAILLLSGIGIQFGIGWSLMAAGIICIYTGMRLETRDNGTNQTGT